MKRALLGIVIVVALVFVWLVGRSNDEPQRTPHDGGVAAIDESTPARDAVLASSDEATPSSIDDVRTVATDDAVLTEASALVGRTLADFIVVREGLDGPLFRDFEVVVIASDGATRRLRSTDPVEARDSTIESLWILLLPGACPRFVDPNAVARGVDANANAAPLELRVLPSATLVVRMLPAPSGAAPIERVALHDGGSAPLPRAWRDVTNTATADYEQFVPESRSWRRLVDDAATDAERAAALRTLRSSAAFEEVAANVALNAFGFVLPWIARAEPASDAVTFDNVPTIARLSVVVECADALEHDGVPSSGHRQRQQSGGCALTNLVLERGETRVVNVHHVAHASVRGAFPVDARAPFGLEIAIFDSLGSGGTSLVGTWLPPPESGGPFEIQGVVPGRHRFVASWHGESGERRSFETEFEVAPGATHDVGTLDDASLTLELHAHIAVDAATSAAGRELDVDELASLVEVAPEDRFGRGNLGRFVWIGSGETVRVGGLPAGRVNAKVVAVVARETTAEPAPDFARRHRLEHRSGVTDVGSGLHVVNRTHYSAQLPRADPLELEVTVAASGSVALDVFVPAEFVRPGAVTTVWWIPGGTFGTFNRHLTQWRGDPSGGGFMSGTISLPIGEWYAFAHLALPVTADEPRVGVALGKVLVEVGATRTMRVELERAATLSFAADDARAPRGLTGLILAELPQWQYFTPFAGAAVGDRILVSDLLPDSDYTTERGDVVRAGPPGSVTVVE